MAQCEERRFDRDVERTKEQVVGGGACEVCLG